MNALKEYFSLSGRVAIVTGAGGHLCSRMAKALAVAGSDVVVADLRYEKAVAVCESLSDLEARIVPFEIDATSPEQWEALTDFTIGEFGFVDILVNGAGANSATPYFDIPLEQWRSVFASQIDSTFLGCQVVGKKMVEREFGSIVNISSASAGPPLSKAFAYSASKAAILNLTQNLGREWALNNVRVNAIRPGFFPTEWNRKNFITPEREEAILGHTPMNRYGEPEELEGALIWLCSKSASFVTGAEIAVDGGYSCMTI